MVHAARAFHSAQRRGVQEKFPVAAIQYPRGPKALGWGMSINTHSGTTGSKSKEVAFSLLYALGDRRMAYLVGKDNGYLIGRVDNLDALKELAEDPFLKLQQKCSEESANFWTARNFRGAEVVRGITNRMDLVWLGKRPLDRPFMGELKKTLDEILARPA
jgi:hypothetical protein